MIKLKRKLHIRNGNRGRKRVEVETNPPEPLAPGRVPRVSRLMALAIRFDRLIQEGVVSDQTELASLVHVTQPRITQIMNLLYLAPDIQETLLFLPRVTEGKDPITEKMLRPIAAEVSWERQREMWARC